MLHVRHHGKLRRVFSQVTACGDCIPQRNGDFAISAGSGIEGRRGLLAKVFLKNQAFVLAAVAALKLRLDTRFNESRLHCGFFRNSGSCDFFRGPLLWKFFGPTPKKIQKSTGLFVFSTLWSGQAQVGLKLG